MDWRRSVATAGPPPLGTAALQVCEAAAGGGIATGVGQHEPALLGAQLVVGREDLPQKKEGVLNQAERAIHAHHLPGQGLDGNASQLGNALDQRGLGELRREDDGVVPPEEFIALATEKISAINGAYDEIAKERGI